MALTVEEIKIKVTSEDSGLKKLNSEITQLEAKIKSLQASPRGNVSNFAWFKNLETTLQNAKVAQQQLTQSNSTYSQSLSGVTSNIGGYVTQLATVIALQKAWEISLNSAKFEVLKSNFKGLESDLDAFRNSTAGTVSDANLIKLSNQATDLGIGLKEQAILFSLAEDAADKYGTGIEEGFQKVVMASEGNIKGLKSLGIQKEVYEQIVKDMAKAHGDEIDKLDAETQKEIRIQAIIKASGTTYEDATKKVKDAADEQEALIAIVGNLTDKYGGLVVKGLIPFYNAILKLPNAIKNTYDQVVELSTTVQKTADAFTWLISDVIDLRRQSEEAIVFDIRVNNNLPNVKDVRSLLPDNATLEQGIRQYMLAFNTTWEQASQKVIGDLNLGFAKENDGQSGTKSKNTTTKTSGKNKEIKETTELVKNLGKVATGLTGAITPIALSWGLDFNVLSNKISYVRERVVEETQIMQEALSEFANGAVTAMGSFFGSLIPPQNALSPLQQFLKSIALTFINSVQTMILASAGAASAKGITSFGLSLITDLPLLAAAWASLEAAKGFIGSFKDGSDMLRIAGNRSSDSGIARVSNGEMIMNARAVQRNYPTLQAMQRGGSVGGSETGVYISADVAGMLKIHEKNARDLRQHKKWKRF